MKTIEIGSISEAHHRLFYPFVGNDQSHAVYKYIDIRIDDLSLPQRIYNSFSEFIISNTFADVANNLPKKTKTKTIIQCMRCKAIEFHFFF